MGTSYNPKIVTDGLVLNLDPANVKSYPAGQDPFVNNVSLMLSMDGANNSTTFIDSSQNALAITALADAKISTAQSKFGGSAAYFDGTGDYLTVANNAVNAFGLGDFTIECWVNFSALPGTNQFMGIANTMTSIGSATTTMWWLALENVSGTNRLRLGRHGNGLVYAYFNWTPSLNTWYHIAVTRSSSSVISMFIDGVSQSVTTSGSNWANNFSATTILAVGAVATALTFNGYIDDFRLTRAARYTASFTPPTAPLSLPGVVTDITKNKINSTLIAGPTYSSTNGGSLLFDGGTQYINIGSNSNLILGTNDFALELWFKPVSRAQLYPFLLHNEIGAGSAINCWQINDRHANNPTLATFWCYNYNAFSSSMLASTSAISNGNWYHLVITRIGNIFSMYLNSVLQSTVTSSISVDGGASMNYGFNTTGQGGFNGNSSIIKVYKGKGFTNNEILQNFNATKGRFGL
jgi:hypothetical protein